MPICACHSYSVNKAPAVLLPTRMNGYGLHEPREQWIPTRCDCLSEHERNLGKSLPRNSSVNVGSQSHAEDSWLTERAKHFVKWQVCGLQKSITFALLDWITFPSSPVSCVCSSSRHFLLSWETWVCLHGPSTYLPAPPAAVNEQHKDFFFQRIQFSYLFLVFTFLFEHIYTFHL